MTAPTPGTGFQAEVYSFADPKTLLDFLPRRTQFTSLEEIKNVGGGSVAVLANDPSIVENPALLEYQNVVKVKHDGKVTGAFLIQNQESVTVSAGEHADEAYLLSGEGLRAWFRMAQVYPLGGLEVDSPDSRRFSYTTPRGTWYDVARWVTPSAIQQYNMDPNDGPFGTAPAQWPDIPSAKWIWGQAGTGNAAAGMNYFRYEFSTQAGQSSKHSLFAAARSSMTVYLDGEQIMQTEADDWFSTMRSDFTLKPGAHVLAVAAKADDGHPAGLIAALFRDNILLTATGAEDATNWKVNAYPTQAPGWTVGEIILTLLDEAQDRGVLFPGWLTPTFTEKEDSYGNAWGTSLDWVFDTGTELIDVIAQMEEVGVDLWIDPDTYELHMAGTRGADKSVQSNTAEPVALRIGKNLSRAEQRGKSELKNTLSVKTDSGWFVQQDSATASVSKYGRVEGLLSTNLNPELSRQVSKVVFEQKALPWTASTYSLVPVAGAVPYEDFEVGDWVLAPNKSGVLERVRVLSLSISESSPTGSASYAIEFGTIAEDMEDRFNRWLRGLNKGSLSGSVMNSSPITSRPPSTGSPVDTGDVMRIPAAPTGLSVSSSAYISDTGFPNGRLTVSWNAVILATNNTAMSIFGYDVAVRRNEGGAPWIIVLSTNGTQAVHAPVETGISVQVMVRARGEHSTRPGLWSDVVTLTVEKDTVPPAVPSVPILTTRLGTIRVDWDGKTASSGTMPSDFANVEVAMGTTNMPTEVIDTLFGRGFTVVTDQPYDALRYFRFRAKDHSGNYSQWSPVASIATKSLVDADLVDTTISEQFDQIQEDIATVNQTAGAGRITTSPNAPVVADAEGKVDGALWYRYANNELIGIWRLQGDEGFWVTMPLSRTFIPQLDIGSGTFGDLDGVRIKAHTISTNSLAIGVAENYIVDPTFADAELRATRLQRFPDDPVNFIDFVDQSSSANSLRLSYSDEGKTVNGYFGATGELDGEIPVTPGQVLSVGVWVRGHSTVRWWFSGYVRHASGAITHANLGMPYRAPNSISSWVSHEWVAPSTAVGFTLLVQRAVPGTNGDTSVAGTWVQFEQPSVRNVVPGVLIAGGAVTADKIASNAVTALKIAANAVTADSIDAGAVTTVKLAADAVTASKIDADAITAKHTLTGATIQTSATSARGIKINNSTGFTAYDSLGRTAMSISTTGSIVMIGTIQTGVGDNQVVISDGIFRGRPGVRFDTGSTDAVQPTAQSLGVNSWGFPTGSFVINGREQVLNSSGRADLVLHHGGDFTLTQNWGTNSDIGISKVGQNLFLRGAMTAGQVATSLFVRGSSPQTQAPDGFFTFTYGAPAKNGYRRAMITADGNSGIQLSTRNLSPSGFVANFAGPANNNTSVGYLAYWEG